MPPSVGDRYHPVPVSPPVPCAPLHSTSGRPGARERTRPTALVAVALATLVTVSTLAGGGGTRWGTTAVAGAAPVTVATVDPGEAGDAGGAGDAGDAGDSILENPLGTEPGEEVGSSTAEDRKVWAVVAGLILVALALTALTVRYWRQTRPVGGGRRGPRAAGSRRSRRAGRSRRSGRSGRSGRSTGDDPVADRADPAPDPGGDELDDLFVDD